MKAFSNNFLTARRASTAKTTFTCKTITFYNLGYCQSNWLDTPEDKFLNYKKDTHSVILIDINADIYNNNKILRLRIDATYLADYRLNSE